jgi:predicted Fe-Mo cluster-binding NifX family protein
MDGSGYPPEIMHREGVEIMICQGLGKRAIGMFKDLGINVFIGAFGTVRDAVHAYKVGILKKADETNACGKHAFGDRHHH